MPSFRKIVAASSYGSNILHKIQTKVERNLSKDRMKHPRRLKASTKPLGEPNIYIIFSSSKHQHRPWGPPSLLFSQNQGVFLPGGRANQPGREANHSHPFITEVNIWWSCKSTSPYAFIGCSKDNFSFIFKHQRFETRDDVHNMESLRQAKEQCTLPNNYLNNALYSSFTVKFPDT